jgi:hypothetical protein
LVHKYRVWSAGAATTTEPISSSNLGRFLGDNFCTANSAARTREKTAQIPLALIHVLPLGAYFTCHYQGVSHAKWHYTNDEYAPAEIRDPLC